MLLKKELSIATGADTSNLAIKNDFITLKAKVDKLGFNKLLTFQLLWIISRTKLLI